MFHYEQSYSKKGLIALLGRVDHIQLLPTVVNCLKWEETRIPARKALKRLLPSMNNEIYTGFTKSQRHILRHEVLSDDFELASIVMNALLRVGDIDALAFLNKLLEMCENEVLHAEAKRCLHGLEKIQSDFKDFKELLRPAYRENQSEQFLLRPHGDDATTRPNEQFLLHSHQAESIRDERE